MLCACQWKDFDITLFLDIVMLLAALEIMVLVDSSLCVLVYLKQMHNVNMDLTSCHKNMAMWSCHQISIVKGTSAIERQQDQSANRKNWNTKRSYQNS